MYTKNFSTPEKEKEQKKNHIQKGVLSIFSEFQKAFHFVLIICLYPFSFSCGLLSFHEFVSVVLTTPDGKLGDLEEHASIAGRSINSYGHYGNQCGRSSETWKSIYLTTQLYPKHASSS